LHDLKHVAAKREVPLHAHSIAIRSRCMPQISPISTKEGSVVLSQHNSTTHQIKTGI